MTTLNSEIKQKLNARMRRRKVFGIFHMSATTAGGIAIMIPALALSFTAFLAYKINIDTNQYDAKAYESNQIKGRREEVQKNIANDFELDLNSIEKEYKIEKDVTTPEQQYSQGQALAAVQKLLNYYDLNLTQEQLLGDLTFASPNKPKPISNGYLWANPKEGFVGEIEGKLSYTENLETKKFDINWGETKGFTIMPEGLQSIFDTYLEGAKITSTYNHQRVVDSISKDTPVLAWVPQTTSLEKYVTTDAKEITIYDYQIVVLSEYKITDDGNIIFPEINSPIEGELEGLVFGIIEPE